MIRVQARVLKRKVLGYQNVFNAKHISTQYSRSLSTFTTRQHPLTGYTCDVDAEPLYCYKPGGYHPTELGDLFNNCRYKTLQKLGWGGYSTVWAAKDNKQQKYVALKINIANTQRQSQEYRTMKELEFEKTDLALSQHVTQMLDHFQIRGPNGIHNCIVLELLGPSVLDVFQNRFNGERLPGALAKQIMKEVIKGVSYLHRRDVAHGDLHTRNIAFSLHQLPALSENEFIQQLGPPQIGAVKRTDGQSLENGKPSHLVMPTSFLWDPSFLSNRVKICDFGQAFLKDNPPKIIHTPLAVRPPEVIFGDQLSHCVDLWSLGCMIFELVVGQPPFDSIMTTPEILVQQMLEMTREKLPARWQNTQQIVAKNPVNGDGSTLQEWLEKMYFDGERREDFSHSDIRKVGELVSKLLRLEPCSRASTDDILRDPWFRDV